MMDDPEGLRLTVNVSLVVRVTRAKVLQRYASEKFHMWHAAIGPEGFTPGAHEAPHPEGLDTITAGPSGQLRYLSDPGAVVAGIPGVAVENSAMTVEVTPEWVVQRLREVRGFTGGYLYDTGLADTEPPDNIYDEEPDEPPWFWDVGPNGSIGPPAPWLETMDRQ